MDCSGPATLKDWLWSLGHEWVAEPNNVVNGVRRQAQEEGLDSAGTSYAAQPIIFRAPASCFCDALLCIHRSLRGEIYMGDTAVLTTGFIN
jgi:hypothetical protein